MQESVNELCADHEHLEQGLKILNVGFGLGIVNQPFLYSWMAGSWKISRSTPFSNPFQTPPSLHVIIEPHPDVLQHMKDLGWHTKPGVKILEGKWQDFVDNEQLTGRRRI